MRRRTVHRQSWPMSTKSTQLQTRQPIRTMSPMPGRLHNNQQPVQSVSGLLPELQSNCTGKNHLRTMFHRLLLTRPIHLLAASQRMCTGQQHRFLYAMQRRLRCKHKWSLLLDDRILPDLPAFNRPVRGMHPKLLH
jgi:hypothetical protein